MLKCLWFTAIVEVNYFISLNLLVMQKLYSSLFLIHGDFFG